MFDTNYGNYRSMGIDDRLPDFDEIFTDGRYVHEAISELVSDLFSECFSGNENKEEYWDEFIDFCKDCI